MPGGSNGFADRRAAGARLAREVGVALGAAPADVPGLLVLALPRGGVPVAYEVARHLGAPLDVFLVRKLGVPGHEELAMGALAAGDVVVWNQDVLALARPDTEALERVKQRERRELERREQLYRAGRPPLDLAGRTVVLVDDGLATGATMRAAARAVRALEPTRLLVAVPVAAPDAVETLHEEADDVVCCVLTPDLDGVGAWYDDFRQTCDEEVRFLLALRREETGEAEAAAAR